MSTVRADIFRVASAMTRHFQSASLLSRDRGMISSGGEFFMEAMQIMTYEVAFGGTWL